MKFLVPQFILGLGLVFAGFKIQQRQISYGDGTNILSMDKTKKVLYKVYYDGSSVPTGIGKFSLNAPSCLQESVVITNLTGWQHVTSSVSTSNPLIVEFAIHLLDLPGQEYCDADNSTICSGWTDFPFELELDLNRDPNNSTTIDHYPCSANGTELIFRRTPDNSIQLTDKLAEFIGPRNYSFIDQTQSLTNVYPTVVNPGDRFFLYFDWNAQSQTASPWDNVSIFRFPISETCKAVICSSGNPNVSLYGGNMFFNQSGELVPIFNDALGGAGGLNDFGAGVNVFEITNVPTQGCGGPIVNYLNYVQGGTYRMVFLNGIGFILREVKLYRGIPIACEVAPEDLVIGNSAVFDEASLSLNIVDKQGVSTVACTLESPPEWLDPNLSLKDGFELSWYIEKPYGVQAGTVAASGNQGDSTHYTFSISDLPTDFVVKAVLTYKDDSNSVISQVGWEILFSNPFLLSEWSLTEEFSDGDEDTFFDPGEVIEVASGQNFTPNETFAGFIGKSNGTDRFIIYNGQNHLVYNASSYTGLPTSTSLGQLENNSNLIQSPYVAVDTDNDKASFVLFSQGVTSSEAVHVLFGWEPSSKPIRYRKEVMLNDVFNPGSTPFLDHDFTLNSQLEFSSQWTPRYSNQDPFIVPATPIVNGNLNGTYGWFYDQNNQAYYCELAPLESRTADIPVFYLWSDLVRINDFQGTPNFFIEMQHSRNFFANWNYGGALQYRIKTGNNYGNWLNINSNVLNSFPFLDLGYAGVTACLLNAQGEDCWTEETQPGDPEEDEFQSRVFLASGDYVEFRIFAENPDETTIPEGFKWDVSKLLINRQEIVQDNYFGIQERIFGDCIDSYLSFEHPEILPNISIKWFENIDKLYSNDGLITVPKEHLPDYSNTFYCQITENVAGGVERIVKIQKSGVTYTYEQFLNEANSWRMPPTVKDVTYLIGIVPLLCQ